MKKKIRNRYFGNFVLVILIMIFSSSSVLAEDNYIPASIQAEGIPAMNTLEIDNLEDEQSDPNYMQMIIQLPEEVIIKADTPTYLDAIFEPEEAISITHWQSSDPSVLQVDENGMMVGIKRGTAIISAAGGNQYSTCKVVVRFSDVEESSYYYDDVLWAVDTGITSGVSDISFAPELTCTRAQLVTFLWRYNGSPEPDDGSTNFKDINSSDYYYKAVAWANQNEIVSGISSDSFAPDRICTRGEAITFFWRCQRMRSSAEPAFNDVNANDFYYYAVKWAVEKGITNGVEPNRFAPSNPVTRGQIVRFLHLADNTKSAVLDKSKWQIIFIEAEKVLDKVGHDLRSAFNWSSSMPYYGHNKYMPDTADPGIEWYADYGFKNKKGNCYVMAATFYEMAINLGYNARQMSGKVPLRVGGLGPHSWVEIKINGTTYVFDPDFTESTGKNGYMIHYGQSGTWRYQSYSPMSR